VAIRRLARRLPPMATFAVTAAMTTALLLLPAVGDGHMGVMWSSSGKIQLAVFFSGAMCVGATQILYFVSLKRIGVAYTSLVSLGTPFLTGVFAFMVLGEVLGFWQWLCGAVLVAGLAFMIHGSLRRVADDSEDIQLEGR